MEKIQSDKFIVYVYFIYEALWFSVMVRNCHLVALSFIHMRPLHSRWSQEML